MSDGRERDTLVMGLGNPLMGDDGLGLAALERMQELWEAPPEVRLMDGGTWGMNLLPAIEDAGSVLLLDAIDTGITPGSAVTLEHDRLPRYLGTKVSPHQVDLRDVLGLAELRGTLPTRTVALGLQPGRVELGMGLSPEVAAGVDGLVAAAVQLLQAWGHRCRPKTGVPLSA
jgi:hydrogenase maturation protease